MRQESSKNDWWLGRKSRGCQEAGDEPRKSRKSQLRQYTIANLSCTYLRDKTVISGVSFILVIYLFDEISRLLYDSMMVFAENRGGWQRRTGQSTPLPALQPPGRIRIWHSN